MAESMGSNIFHDDDGDVLVGGVGGEGDLRMESGVPRNEEVEVIKEKMERLLKLLGKQAEIIHKLEEKTCRKEG